MRLDVRVLDDVVIIRIRERRLVFPQLENFASTVKALLAGARTDLVLNLSEIDYLDSPAHGCLFDLYGFVKIGAVRKFVGFQPRVQMMASLVGLTRTCEVFPDEERALGVRGRMP